MIEDHLLPTFAFSPRFLARLALLILCYVLVALVSACGGAPDSAAQAPAVQSPVVDLGAQAGPLVMPTLANLPLGASGQAIVARVNGIEISQTQLERALARDLSITTAADPVALRAAVLDTLIEQTLIRQAAEQFGIVVTDAEIDAQIASDRALTASDAAWAQFLSDNQYTEAEYRESTANVLLTQRVQVAVTQNLGGDVQQAHARHILVATQAEAEAIIAQLQGGADFTQLAAAVSLDTTTRNQGGDLGWFTRGELFETAIEEAAFNQPVGNLSIVATRLGYHVLQTLELGQRAVASENQADLQRTMFENWLQSLLDNASIERFM
jgi:peptidyl-prolyl cis-trans isomerase C